MRGDRNSVGGGGGAEVRRSTRARKPTYESLNVHRLADGEADRLRRFRLNSVENTRYDTRRTSGRRISPKVSADAGADDIEDPTLMRTEHDDEEQEEVDMDDNQDDGGDTEATVNIEEEDESDGEIVIHRRRNTRSNATTDSTITAPTDTPLRASLKRTESGYVDDESNLYERVKRGRHSKDEYSPPEAYNAAANKGVSKTQSNNRIPATPLTAPPQLNQRRAISLRRSAAVIEDDGDDEDSNQLPHQESSKSGANFEDEAPSTESDVEDRLESRFHRPRYPVRKHTRTDRYVDSCTGAEPAARRTRGTAAAASNISSTVPLHRSASRRTAACAARDRIADCMPMAFNSPAHKRRNADDDPDDFVGQPNTSRRNVSRRGDNRSRRRGKAAGGDNSSTTSGSDDEDKRRFDRRTAKSLNRARERFLPMNFEKADALRGTVRDRVRASAATGGSCADLDPMGLDRSVGFHSIGGLTDHVLALKEMVLFPLLYPEVFAKFNVEPPKGVVFYGPPGTGKTLVARALANECSKEDGRKIAFFMRKGADCLSKWVGESERQLRLLFDQAFTMRPSIIFFDELDGLAPVRSTRQDQIHSSIVSTLLALMDGLDQRGEVIVIGATNRLDSLDPALRRPGRFDREFPFNLPNRDARRKILQIHTGKWNPVPETRLLDFLADNSVGYCGADLKGICTESVLIALRKRYPQLYCADTKLLLNADRLCVDRSDFELAMSRIKPASQRGVERTSKPLSNGADALLKGTLNELLTTKIPQGFQPVATLGASTSNSADTLSANNYAAVLATLKAKRMVPGARLLLYAPSSEFGQTSHVAPALLHALDHLTVHSLSIPTLFAVSNHRPEEAVAEALKNACRGNGAGPSVLYLPAIDEWDNVVPDSAWHTLVSTIESWDAFNSVLILATAHRSYERLPDGVRGLFRRVETYDVPAPTDEQRRVYFVRLLVERATVEPERNVTIHEQLLEAPQEPPRRLNPEELRTLRKQEQQLLRELRIFLREMLGRVCRDRRFKVFAEPVDDEVAPDYYTIIKSPMDLSEMMNKIDMSKYQTVEQFLADIDLITSNAIEYNPPKDEEGRMIRHRANLLKDFAYALIDLELDPDFERRLKEAKEARKRRDDQDYGADGKLLPLRNSSVSISSKQPTPHHRYSTRSGQPLMTPLREKAPTDFSQMACRSASETTVIPAPAMESGTESQPKAQTSAEGTKRKATPRRKNIWCRPKRKRPGVKQRNRRNATGQKPSGLLRQTSLGIVKKYSRHRQGMGASRSGARSGSSNTATTTTIVTNGLLLDANQTDTANDTASQQSSNVITDEKIAEEQCETVNVSTTNSTASTVEDDTQLQLIIDRSELCSLSDRAVVRTVGWTLRSVERFGARLAAVIDRFTDAWDRTTMVAELVDLVDTCKMDDH